jgi:hypothetical protein
MNFDEAINILGITENASFEEIDTAYKQLAQKYHPDKGGNGADMVLLNEARIYLIEHLSAKSLPLAQKQLEIAIQKINDISIGQKISARKAEKIERNILNLKTNKLKKWKRAAYVLAAISAAALFVDKDFLDLFSGTLSEEDAEKDEMDEIQNSIGMIYILLLSIGAVAGFAAWCLSQKISKIEDDLVEFHESLLDKYTYVELMKTIFGGEIPKQWNLKMMNDALNENCAHIKKLINIHKGSNIRVFFSILNAIGTEKVTQLLLLKGQEYSFLSVQHGNEDNEYTNYYALL